MTVAFGSHPAPGRADELDIDARRTDQAGRRQGVRALLSQQPIEGSVCACVQCARACECECEEGGFDCLSAVLEPASCRLP